MAEQNARGPSNRQQHDVPIVGGIPGRHGGGFGSRGRGMPVEKAKNFSETLRRLWTFLGNEKKWLSLVFLFIVITSMLTLAGPYLIGIAVDAIAPEDGGGVRWNVLEIVMVVMLTAFIAEAALNFAQNWMMAGVSQRVVLHLRGTMFAKLQKLPLSYFDSRPHGEVMSRLSNDIDNVSTTISQSSTQLMSGIIAIVGSFSMMVYLSPLLTLAALVTVPLVFLLARTITRRTRVLFKAQQAELGALNGHIEETISGLEMVKAFNHEEQSIARFKEVNDRLYAAGLKAQIWSGFLMPLLSVINNIGFVAVAVVGALLAVHGDVTYGVIASFLSYSRQFVRPLNELANTYNMLQAGVAGAERAFEVLDEKEESPDPPDAVDLTNPRGIVTFENVNFGYRSDQPILREVSFTSPQGSSTAFVGPTGAGKTTIVNLLTRFYDVTSGTITIDGRDIREYTRSSLRRCFGIVLQDTYLFSGTVMENIKYGRPEATDEEAIQAAKWANADTFIRRLPGGYAAELTENGGNISQGERQLLAIARVILAKPSILILDEATSSIDTRTELHIQDALLNLMKGRTTFIIAHRLNTIRDADTIMVVQQGMIAERGDHDELFRKGGAYYRMFMHI